SCQTPVGIGTDAFKTPCGAKSVGNRREPGKVVKVQPGPLPPKNFSMSVCSLGVELKLNHVWMVKSPDPKLNAASLTGRWANWLLLACRSSAWPKSPGAKPAPPTRLTSRPLPEESAPLPLNW